MVIYIVNKCAGYDGQLMFNGFIFTCRACK